MFTVKQVSEILNITPHALRYYDNEGLLPGLLRRNKRRLFSSDDVEWIRNIQCWRKSGMPVSYIKRYRELLSRGDRTFDERFKMIIELRDKAIQDVKEANERLELMEEKIKWYETTASEETADRFKPGRA